MHDPLLGASRRLTYSELLELWLPFSANSEILGNVLIAVAQTEPSSEAVCQSCRTPLAPSIPCPNCQKTVGLRPPAVLNCLNDACIARMWNCFCCPECDSLSTIHSHAAAKGAPQLRPTAARLQSPVPASDLDTGKLFDEIDKFIKHVLTLPAASNPEVGKQLDQIAANKEKFKVAYSEHLARSEKIRDQLNAALKAHQAEKEAQLKKMEEAETPAPPLDGEALGRALLQNLGFSQQE